MEFDTKFVVVLDESLAVWQKLNVTAFLTSGVVGEDPTMIGEPYEDASAQTYSSLCIQPVIVLKSARARLNTMLGRAQSRGVKTAVYIEDMFATGHDAANRETVAGYATDALPLVGIALRGDKKTVDKITKGAKLHD
ncbi:MAG: DUF2000 family protein [Pseudomonadota bacterium]